MIGKKRIIRAAIFAGVMVQASGAFAEGVQYIKRRNLFASVDMPGIAARSEPDTYVAHRRGAAVIITLESSTPHVDEREPDCRGGRLTYKLDKSNVFAFSCEVGAEIIYSIAKYGQTYRVGASNATEEIGFTIRYPATQKTYWDPVIAHMRRSLHFAR